MIQGYEFCKVVSYSEASPTGLIWSKGCIQQGLIGKQAGHLGDGKACRSSIRLEGRLYRCHRVVWEIHNGPIPEGMVVDHIDRNGLNNKIENLRVIPQSLNAKNLPKRVDNTSGVTGVTFWTWSKGKYSYDYWVVSWEEAYKTCQKKFSVLKLGSEVAKEMAVQFRKQVMKRLQLTEGYTETHGE